MDRTSSFGFIADPVTGHRRFVDENLATGQNGTDFLAADATAFQEEIMAVIEQGGGLGGNAGDLTQLLQAIRLMLRGALQGSQRFTRLLAYTNSGIFQPPADALWARVRLVGGGGGGGSGQGNLGGAGGGGGGYAEAIIPLPLIPGASIPVTVAPGGPRGYYGGAYAGGGGTSSFGAWLAATGGGPGQSAATFAAGGAGGLGSGGGGGGGNGNGIDLYGGYGSDGNAGPTILAGNGAPSAFGGGGRASNTTAPNVQDGKAPGSGGGGGYNGNYDGGAGANGIVLVEF